MRHLTLAAALLIAACGSPTPESAGSSAAGHKFVVVSAAVPAGSPEEASWRRFEQNIGVWAPEFKLQMRIQGEIATGEALLAELRAGRVQVAGLSAAGAATVVPEVAVLSAPFLFNSEAEADYVLDRFLREPLGRLFADQGLRLLDIADEGWVNLYSREPLRTAADAQGKAWHAPSPADEAFAAALGARAIGTPHAEVLPSLRDGRLDGGAATITEFARQGLVDVAPHYTLTRHAYRAAFIVANKDWFDRLTPHDKGVFMDAHGSADQARADTRAAATATRRDLESRGVVLREPVAEGRLAWAAAGSAARPAIVGRAGGRAQEILDLALRGKDAFAASQAAAAAPGEAPHTR
jgi:TRAP-type C4-dicarboxylate transport system substrate-binding protein